MPKIIPRCPEHYKIDKSCKCIKKETKSKKKITAVPKEKKSNTYKKKRCKKGTRKNKKTGKCESYRVNKTLVIPNSTPQADRDLGKAIQTLITEKKINVEGRSDQFSGNISQIRAELVKQKSFSPTVNKRLVSIHKDIIARDVFGCGIEKLLKDKQYSRTPTWKIPKS